MSVARLVLLFATLGLMQVVPSYVGGADGADQRLAAAALTLGVGFVLIAAWLLGRLAAEIRLPKLTGYLVAGIVAGPAVLGFLSSDTVEGMGLVNGCATGLIALTAGSEMDFRAMRPLLRSIGWISSVAVLGSVVLLFATFVVASPLFPFLDGMSFSQRLAVSFMLAVVAVAQSPAVVVALRAETGADGAVARTVLGVVVLADLVILVLFAISSSVAGAVLSGAGDAGSAAFQVSWELFGSLGFGTLVGVLFSVWLRLVGTEGLDLFVLAVCVVAAEVGRRLHLDPLLMLLAAGTWVENISREGARLRHAFEDASLPVYIVFFTVAGAAIDIDIPLGALVPVVLVVLVRGVGLTAGTFVAARIAGAPKAVAQYGGIGLLPQAGLAIALAILVARSYPGFGVAASVFLLQLVAVNQLVGPALMRWSLVRAGEARGPRADAARGDPDDAATDTLATAPYDPPQVAPQAADSPPP